METVVKISELNDVSFLAVLGEDKSTLTLLRDFYSEKHVEPMIYNQTCEFVIGNEKRSYRLNGFSESGFTFIK